MVGERGTIEDISTMSKRWRNGHHHHYWRLCCFVAISLLSVRNKQCRYILLVAAGAPTLFTTSNTQPPPIISTDEDVVVSIETTSTTSSTFFDKFETYGPTLTLTLRDPSTTTLLGGGIGDRGRSKLWPFTDKHYNKEVTKIKPLQQEAAGDDGTFGLSSKLAAIFHITPTTYSQPSSSSSTTSSKFDDGYMLDDGEIFLDPPAGSSSSKSRGLFSIREMGNSILKSNEWGKSWAQSVHPEMQFEMKTREQQSTTATGTANCNESNPNDVVHAVDTRPFPDTAPWLSGISCGMKWSPFPIYKAGYTGDGYGHKLLSVPHYIRCGAKISLPRFSSMIRQSLRQSTSRGSGGNIALVDQTREINLGITYQENPYQSDTGTVELLLGRVRSSLPPAAKLSTMKKSLLSSSDKYRRNNHFLVRLSTGRRRHRGGAATTYSNENNNSMLSSIEYIKGSFRMPTPSFMRSKIGVLRGKGVSVSPSYDFEEGLARCVVSGDVGSSGQTRAVLRLDADDSTLTVVRALDER